MGSTPRGPVPKRSTQRRRRNKESQPQKARAEVSTVKAPAEDKDWHKLAKAWYRSLKVSGQAQFYEPSDWQQARILAEILSRALGSEKLSANLMAAWFSAAGELLTTEGTRRRMRLELEREDLTEGEDAAVAAMADYRAKVGR